MALEHEVSFDNYLNCNRRQQLESFAGALAGVQVISTVLSI